MPPNGLLDEIKHRVRNMLGMIGGIATQTFRKCPDYEKQAFAARLGALAGAHDALIDKNWSHAHIATVIAGALAPFRQGRGRFEITGPDVQLDSKKSILITMAVHELATNAVKYGALSGDTGNVLLHWEVDDRQRLKIHWRESDGPPVTAPRKTGFGTKLITHAFRTEQGTARFNFAPGGLGCFMELDLSRELIEPARLD